MEIPQDTDMVCVNIVKNCAVPCDQIPQSSSTPRSSSKKRCKRKSNDADVKEGTPKKCRTADSRKDSSSGDLSDQGCKTLVKKHKKCSRSPKDNFHLNPQELKNVIEGMDEEIDDVLEETAHKNKLTATNVKNILRHVITNEYVLAMVRNTMKTETNESDDLEEAPFEPKLTRSRVKELREKQHMQLPWPMSSPMKQPKTATKSLLEEEFSDESSSDEDYKPNEEECLSEEDNAALSPKSTDLDSSICEKIASPVVKIREEDADEESGLTIVLPEPDITSEDTEVDKIALRTRSKLPLKDTPLEAIEASFIAPDITVDMYDTNCDDEEWQNFLREFNKPIDVAAVEKPEEEPDDAEDDPEYNVLEDDDIPDELDLRFDNAVKITRKELNALMAEIMESAQVDFNDGDDEEEEEPEIPGAPARIETPCRVETPCPVEMNEEFVENVRTQWMTPEERVQLEEQMRMYVQLLTQSFLLSCGAPELKYINISSKLLLDELKMFASCAVTVNEQSAFYAHNLDGALDIISEYENEPTITVRPYYTKNKLPGIASAHTKKTLFTSNVFMYPDLLPVCGFHKSYESRKAIFTSAEDNLIALGLEQFSFTTSPIYYIKDLLVPTKTEEQIKLRIKNSRNQKAPLNNPIKYYYKFQKAPPLPRTVRLFDPSNVKAPKDLPRELLPKWMRCMFEPVLTTKTNLPLLPKEGTTSITVSPNKCTISPAKPLKPLRTLLPRNNHFSPLKHISPILKKYNQKRHIMPSSPSNSNNRTRKCVHFAKRLVIKPAVIASSEPERINCVNISAKIHVQESGNTSIVNTSTNIESENFNPDAVQTKALNPAVNSDPQMTTNNSSNTENILNFKGTKPADCNTELNTNVCDIVESETVDDVDEEIVDDEPESTIQQDPTSTNCTVSKKHSANKKKNKHQRDLESSLALLQPNILENDPKREEREALFANAYLLRVTEAVKENPDTYEIFLKCLLKYQHSTKSPVKLYFEIKEVLKDYPALVNDFVGFLQPEQARDCGMYKEYVTLSKIREFIRKIELHFQNQPQHLIKILKTFAQFKQQSGITSPEVLATLQPLLKNQSHLMEELNGLLPDVAPPEHLMTDFEEMAIPNSDDDNSSIDSCEEIMIPDAPDPYGSKDCPCDCHISSTETKVVNKIRHCVKCGIKFIDGRIYIQTGKVLKPAQVIYHNVSPEPAKIPNNDPKISTKNKQSAATSTSNSIAVHTEQPSKPEVFQAKKDPVKTIPVIPQPLIPTEEVLPSTSKLPCDVIEDTVFPTVSNCINKKSVPPDFSHLKDMIGHVRSMEGKSSVTDKIAANLSCSSKPLQCSNVTTSQNAQWTSDEDHIIIYNLQRFNCTEKFLQVSITALKTRSEEEVQERLFHLMNKASKEKQ